MSEKIYGRIVNESLKNSLEEFWGENWIISKKKINEEVLEESFEELLKDSGEIPDGLLGGFYTKSWE